jgi:acyl-CoA thioesterase-1
VAFGDSLTAGYLLKNKDSFPSQLSSALSQLGYQVEIINSGVSGDTTADGVERLEWAIPPNTEAVILELGANDALRGLPPEEAKKNLEKIITHLQKRNIEILLAGMKSPKNWGEQYARTFDSLFEELAQKYHLLIYPFFLEGVALNPSLVLEDGLHPNEKGVAEIVRRILPQVEELIKHTSAKKEKK